MGEGPNPDEAHGEQPYRPESGDWPSGRDPGRADEPYPPPGDPYPGPHQAYPPPPPPGWQQSPPPQWGGGPGQPPPPQWGPPGPVSPPPNNHMAFAIITTIMCCLPLGIVSIVKAAEVNSLWAQGHSAAARASAESARKWALWSLLVSVIVWVLVVIFYAVIFGFVVAAGNTSGY